MSKNSGVDPEFLQAALDHLTRPKGFGQRKDMERLVLEALARYQGLRSNSLLWSDVREELKDIERAAAELLKRLRRASAFSISRLGTSTRLRPFFRKAYDANGRPVQSRGSWDDAYEAWRQRKQVPTALGGRLTHRRFRSWRIVRSNRRTRGLPRAQPSDP